MIYRLIAGKTTHPLRFGSYCFHNHRRSCTRTHRAEEGRIARMPRVGDMLAGQNISLGHIEVLGSGEARRIVVH